jgi:photosystem II stability/assembly factor-like uncharacterized protein
MNYFLKVISAIIISVPVYSASAQQIEILTNGPKTSIRGLSVVTDDIVWVSGSGGKVGKSINAGKTWVWMTVPGFEQREFQKECSSMQWISLTKTMV